MPEPTHTTLDLPRGWDVEIVRAPCACPAGRVCPADGPFASACPRRRHPEDARLAASDIHGVNPAMTAGTFPADVIAAAVASRRRWAVPASVTLAQWAVESAWGRAMSGKNNPFGIKAVPGQPGTPRMTREVIHGETMHETQVFADYPDQTGAFDAHARLLATGKPYGHARSLLPDAEAFAEALTGVYAIDPHYGATLVSVMRAHDLADYDHDGLAAPPAGPSRPPAAAAAGPHLLPVPAPTLWARLSALFTRKAV